MKAMNMIGKPTSKPITVLEFHAFVCPPYWRTRMYKTIAHRSKVVPIGSICKSFSLVVALTGEAFLGVWKKKRMHAAAIPPMGKLM
jgi:hypothetical protein